MSAEESNPPRGGRTAGPLPAAVAWRSVARCVVRSVRMLVSGDVHWPRANVGRRLRFADGTTSRVYRETTVARPAVDPCLLVVSFRLRRVRGAGHLCFRCESWLNTPLFVGFPGFVSKLWLAHDQRARYRGVYEWDGADRAEHYARSLWRVLALVSEPRFNDYRVVPGLRRPDVLEEPGASHRDTAPVSSEWWRLVGAA